jgi:FMN phosphatase YigB (HAD superfamily)
MWRRTSGSPGGRSPTGADAIADAIATRPIVLVDLDDTCVPDRSAMRAAIAATLTSVDLDGADHAVDEILAAARAAWWAGPHHDFCHGIGISSWEGLWLGDPSDGWPSGFEPWLRGYQTEAWPVPLAERFVVERASRCAPFPGVDAALAALAEDADLWLVTNGDSRLQRRKLVGAGLAERFDRVFVSGDIGSRKPEATFFDWVTDTAAAAGRSIVASIGDSIDNDIRPAVERGWLPVAVRCDDTGGDVADDLAHVAVVATLVDVPSLLRQRLRTAGFDGRNRQAGVPE